MKVAVVGGGAAGMSAAWHLAGEAEVTLFEAANRLGGLTDTHSLMLDGRTYSLDSGFTVFNIEGYPGFSAWLDALGVPTQQTDVSMSVRNLRTGLEYGSKGLDSLFCQRRNLLRPGFWGMLKDLRSFYREAARLDVSGQTVAELVERERYGRAFVDDHLVPLCSAVWSLPPAEVLNVPAAHVVQFMARHHMLRSAVAPQWRVISGGSRRYVAEFSRAFAGRIRCATPVRRIERRADGRIQLCHAGGEETFDAVVIACHSDQALRLLGDPSPLEQEVLGAIRYRASRVVIHSDPRVMPANRRAWCSWNVLTGDGCQVTCWMNRLQSLPGDQEFFVTLNPSMDLDHIWSERVYEHPEFDARARTAQGRWAGISGVGNTYYCGAYWGFGSQEDAFSSGREVALALRDARAMAA